MGLTLFFTMFTFNNLWNFLKILDINPFYPIVLFLYSLETFLGGIEMEHLAKMG